MAARHSPGARPGAGSTTWSSARSPPIRARTRRACTRSGPSPPATRRWRCGSGIRRSRPRRAARRCKRGAALRGLRAV